MFYDIAGVLVTSALICVKVYKEFQNGVLQICEWATSYDGYEFYPGAIYVSQELPVCSHPRSEE